MKCDCTSIAKAFAVAATDSIFGKILSWLWFSLGKTDPNIPALHAWACSRIVFFMQWFQQILNFHPHKPHQMH